MATGYEILVRLAGEDAGLNTALKRGERGVDGFAATVTRRLGPGGVGAALGVMAGNVVGSILALAGRGIRAIAGFVAGAVREFAAAQAISNRLAGTLAGIGVEFEQVRGDLERNAAAFQRSTVFDDDTYLNTLQQLVEISNDYSGSLNNVALAADVAAARKISLEAATTLVGKAMNGVTNGFKRMGIEIREGESGIDALRRQFEGMAQNEARSLQGAQQQIANKWGNIKERLGEVLVGSGLVASAFQNVVVPALDTIGNFLDRLRPKWERQIELMREAGASAVETMGILAAQQVRERESAVQRARTAADQARRDSYRVLLSGPGVNFEQAARSPTDSRTIQELERRNLELSAQIRTGRVEPGSDAAREFEANRAVIEAERRLGEETAALANARQAERVAAADIASRDELIRAEDAYNRARLAATEAVAEQSSQADRLLRAEGVALARLQEQRRKRGLDPATGNPPTHDAGPGEDDGDTESSSRNERGARDRARAEAETQSLRESAAGARREAELLAGVWSGPLSTAPREVQGMVENVLRAEKDLRDVTRQREEAAANGIDVSGLDAQAEGLRLQAEEGRRLLSILAPLQTAYTQATDAAQMEFAAGRLNREQFERAGESAGTAFNMGLASAIRAAELEGTITPGIRAALGAAVKQVSAEGVLGGWMTDQKSDDLAQFARRAEKDLADVATALREVESARRDLDLAKAAGDATAVAMATRALAAAERRVAVDVAAFAERMRAAGVSEKQVALALKELEKMLGAASLSLDDVSVKLETFADRAEAVANLADAFAGLAESMGESGREAAGLLRNIGKVAVALEVAQRAREEYDLAAEAARAAEAKKAETEHRPPGATAPGLGYQMALASSWAGLAAAVLGVLGTLVGGQSEHERAVKENSEALRRVALDLRGLNLNSGETTDRAGEAAAALASRAGEIGRAGMGPHGKDYQRTLVEGILAQFGMDLDELMAVAEARGIDIVDDNGKIIAGALAQLAEKLQMHATAIARYNDKSLDDRDRYRSISASLRDDEENPGATAAGFLSDLAELAPRLFERFGLGQFDTSTEEGRTGLVAALQALLEAWKNNQISGEEIGGFESIAELLERVEGLGDAMKDLREQVDSVSESMLNVPTGEKLFNLAAELFDAQEYQPGPARAAVLRQAGVGMDHLTSLAEAHGVALLDDTGAIVAAALDDLVSALGGAAERIGQIAPAASAPAPQGWGASLVGMARRLIPGSRPTQPRMDAADLLAYIRTSAPGLLEGRDAPDTVGGAAAMLLEYAELQADRMRATMERVTAPPVLPSREALTTIAAGLVSLTVNSTHHSTVTVSAGADPNNVGARAKEGVQAALAEHDRTFVQGLVVGLRKIGGTDAERLASLISNAVR